MNRESLLKMSIYKIKWFALENVNTDPKTYSDLINSLVKVFNDTYKGGAKEYISLQERNGKTIFFIRDQKVPNVVKAIVNNNNYNINIEFHGLDRNGNEVTEVIKKPFEQEHCTRIIPSYNNYGQSHSAQRKAA